MGPFLLAKREVDSRTLVRPGFRWRPSGRQMKRAGSREAASQSLSLRQQENGALYGRLFCWRRKKWILESLVRPGFRWRPSGRQMKRAGSREAARGHPSPKNHRYRHPTNRSILSPQQLKISKG